MVLERGEQPDTDVPLPRAATTSACLSVVAGICPTAVSLRRASLSIKL